MKDRVPANPGRVLITPENGAAAFYATMTRADNPTQDGDPLNKNTLLKDATAAFFGLDANAVPDDVLAFLGKLNLHYWQRRSVSSAYVEDTTNAVTTVQILGADSSSTKSTLYYSSSISINQSTGAVSLVNPSSTTITYNSLTNADKLKGKYFYSSYSSQICFAASDATVSRNTSGTWAYNAYIQARSASAILKTTYGSWEQLSSADKSAYPTGISGGYEYEYCGVPYNNIIGRPIMQFQTGSYDGTGLYGSDNACVLPLRFKPKILILWGAYITGYIKNTTIPILLTAEKNTAYARDDSGNVCVNITATFSDLSVSWYSGGSAYQQLNSKGEKYPYIAIG